MKVKTEDIQECTKLLKVEVPKKKVADEFANVYQDIKKEAQVPGFRVGKAPLELLKSRYSDTVRSEIIKRLVVPAYVDAVKEANLSPISDPEIDNVELEEGKPLRFSAKVDIYPKVEVKRYKGLRVKRRRPEIKEEDVDNILKDLQKKNGELVSAKEERPLKKGDWCLCDFECYVEGKTIEKKKNALFAMDASANLEGLVSGLIGASSGNEKTVEVCLPQNFAQKEYRGKKASFHVKVKEVKELKLPEMNDDFAKRLKQGDTLEELKTKVRNELREREKMRIQKEMEGELSRELLQYNHLEVPSSLIERQLEKLAKEERIRLLYQGYKKENVDAQEENIRKNLKADAESQVKTFFLLKKIADMESIQVTQQEIEERLTAMATSLREDKERLRKRLDVEMLKSRIKEDKVIDFLIREAKVKEVR